MTLTNDQARSAAPGLIDLSPAALSVLNAIVATGGRPLIVGGSVRDALLARDRGEAVDFKDIDIEVYGMDDHTTLAASLRSLGHVDQRGAFFGVVAASVDGEEFDISLPRRDSATSAGHRGFDVEIDAGLDERTAFGRRDFTLNAMGWDYRTAELVDHYGGRADLEAGVLRHTTSAFAEDPLRVLRGAQFAARFGFELAPETVAIARAMAPRFGELSTERVWGEWRKIARRGVDITKALRVLDATAWIEHFPTIAATRGVDQDPEWHPEGDVFTHLGLAADQAAAAAERDGLTGEDREVVVLATLVHDLGKTTTTEVTMNRRGQRRLTSNGHAEAGVAPAKAFLRAIGAPHHIIDRVLPLVYEHMTHAAVSSEMPTASAVRRLIRRLARGDSGATIVDWARVVDADSAGRGAGAKSSPAAAWLEVANRVGPLPRKGILRGDHLIAIGWTPGPAFRDVLDAALEAQDEGEFDDEAGAVEWLAARLGR